MIKNYLLIIWLLLLSCFTYAQTQSTNLDSLTTALKNADNDSVKMVVLFNLAGYYSESNADSCLFFADQGTSIAKKINQPLWIAHFLTENQSYIAMTDGNLPLSFKLANDALKLEQDETNEKNVYIPIDYEFRDPHQFRLSQIGYTLHQLANIYRRAGDRENAIKYYRQEIDIFSALNSKRAMALVQSNMNLGFIYTDANRLDSAIFYINMALAYSEITGWKLFNGLLFQIKGSAYLQKDMLDSAKYFYWQGLFSSMEQRNGRAEVNNKIALAQLYERLGQVDSAKYYAGSVLQQATGLRDMKSTSIAATILSNAWKLQGNTDSAFAYLTLSKTIGDSLYQDRADKITKFQNLNFEQQILLENQTQESIAAKNKIWTIAMLVGLVLLSALVFVFYRSIKQKKKDNKVLESTLSNLKSTQQQLIQSEKMASLGELTAGIAHEIQNPLNFVNNFSEVSAELVDEMNEEILKGNLADAKEIASDLKENLEKINHHGKRAGDIVKGMLQHSRKSEGKKELTDINALCDEYLRLSYHGLRAKDKSFNAEITTDFDAALPKINVVPQDIGRVVLNLINNAFYAVDERKKLHPEGYESVVSVSTKKTSNGVEIRVKDNGYGIPEKIKDKIFQPFFTTKPTGQGTGLGLSLSYDIVKVHGGEIKVETKKGEGSEFVIQLSV
ncbi:MAG: tetratricopeptide repeat protein [Bacteroidetes bacterium]|nr:tetratricopeptide repeat protein [Bacteroidota bacterium]